ncbi:MAG: DUF4189 domain-containing protein [Pseudomonadota bacterium]
MLRLAFISTLAISALTQPALADWGGVAVNSDGIGWGYSAGWKNQTEARNRAMLYCRQHSSDPSKCEVTLVTQRCGAVVRGRVSSRNRLFVAGARNRDIAANTAMAQCRDASGASCELRRAFCANDL